MSETLESLRRQIDVAKTLGCIVSSMKALAASNIAQFENAVKSVDGYYRTIELGLLAAFRESLPGNGMVDGTDESHVGIIVFGSDQGLVGHFNEQISDFTVEKVNRVPGTPQVWVVGERVVPCLTDAGIPVSHEFSTPNSVAAITPLIGNILSTLDETQAGQPIHELSLIYNRPNSSRTFEPVLERVFPFDAIWYERLRKLPWPTRNLPEVLNGHELTVPALVREYLFVSLFKACAESIASENASRLAAMHRADKNISEMLTDLGLSFHQLRQSSIDSELFDLISGFEAAASDHHD